MSTPSPDEEQARTLLHQSSHGYGEDEIYRYRAALAANAYAILSLQHTLRDGFVMFAEQMRAFGEAVARSNISTPKPGIYDIVEPGIYDERDGS